MPSTGGRGLRARESGCTATRVDSEKGSKAAPMRLVEKPQARVSSFMGQGSGATAWARVGDSKTAAMPESLGAGVAAGDRISTSAARYGNHYALLLTYNQAKDAPPASRFLTDRQCS